MTGSTISTTIGKEVVLGSGTYISPLTVTSAGEIAAPAPETSFQGAGAVYVKVNGASIINHGVISAAIPAVDSYTAPAILAVTALDLSNYGSISGQSGVYLQNGGIVTNTGSIAGLETAQNSGYGVRLVEAGLTNSGAVYGAQYGAASADASEITNSGTITGGTAGIKLLSAYLTKGAALSNTGMIAGASGITEANALIANSGTITGESLGIRVSWGGAVTNSGHISAGIDGVLLLNQQYLAQYAPSFNNSGTVQGGYFAMAINFATVTNAAPGLLSGTDYGAGVGDSGYLFNAGNITAIDGGLLVESGGRAGNAGTVRGNSLGIELFSASVATNASVGYVYSLNTAALNRAAYLVNAGTLVGNVYGLELLSGGIAINTGTIVSEREGVYLATLSATSSPDFLDNTGMIRGAGIGVNLRDGTAYNFGTIDAAQVAASLVAGTSFDNAGNLYGTRYGLQLLGGTAVNSGSIGGGLDGVAINHGYFADSGTVSGITNAVYGTSFSLNVDPGAVFQGNVTDNSGAGRLNLGGSSAGTLRGIGTQFNGFVTIDFDAGAQWLISGSNAALAGHQVIDGFEQGDTIVVTGFGVTSDSFVASGDLVLANATQSERLQIEGSFTTADFSVTSNGTLTTVSLQPGAPCFVAGTRILTPRGEIAVEDLNVGETVITQSGEDLAIVWIGRRTIDLNLHPRPEQVQPVCIAAHALAEDVPRRDLKVSPDHALLIDDVLVPAQLLLDGLNIRRVTPASVTYYHVQLAQHAALFAENAPAESYLETGNRNAFDNAGGSLMLHPDFSAMIRREKSFATLLLAGEKLDEIRRRNLHRYRPDVRQLNA